MMKKNFFYAMMSAIALTGAMGFTACTSDEDVAEMNPTYDPVANTVNTQFVLNVAGGEMASTRMSSSTVQRNQNFRGMKDAKLIGLSTGNNSWLAPFAGVSTGYAVNKTYELGQLYAKTAVNNEGTNNQDNSSHRVLELSIPLTTDAMLVYGRAIPTTYEAEVDADACNGKVIYNVAATPENTTFSLSPRLSTSRQTEYSETCALAVKILNRIIESRIETEAAGARTVNGYTNVAALPALTWKQLGTADVNTLVPLEEILANAFKTLTTIHAGEYRAGSSYAISSIAFYVYNIAKSVYSATATSDRELNAQLLAYEIMRRIENYFEKYDNATYTESQTAFLDMSLIKTHMMNATGMSESDFNTAYGSVQHGDLKGFPTSFNLPTGVALLTYDAEDGFSHISSADLPSLIDRNSVLAENHYMYPSELLYFDNSALRVNNASVLASAYPNGTANWDNASEWDGWTNGAVTSSTRSVAVKNNINYGVAMLQTKVSIDTEVGNNFEDNRNAITGEANQKLTYNEVRNLELVGVLVGGQHHQMGWNYLAQNTTAEDWNYVIYDNQIPNGTIPTPTDQENYTLVFDNYIPQAAQTNDVFVALEFKNNGKDFYGIGNMIRSGGTFYLVGKLNLASATNSITWPTTYAIPPYTAAGASQEVSRVFIQDFMTTATFKIGATSLQNAFVTVPDLRSSQTSLGLSVDLKWQTGLNFETVLGAN